jgi:hypothetical protein
MSTSFNPTYLQNYLGAPMKREKGECDILFFGFSSQNYDDLFTLKSNVPQLLSCFLGRCLPCLMFS